MNTLLVFARSPSTAKTRLRRHFPDASVTRLVRAFIVDTLRQAGRLEDLQIQLWFDPPEAAAEMRLLAARAVPGRRVLDRAQGQGTLGERLHAAFLQVLAAGPQRVIAIGADTPDLSAAEIRAGFEALHSKQAVIGPSADGGYYLIGMTRPIPDVFAEIPWSTNRVLKETLDRFAAAGVSYAMLSGWQDVDDYPDVLRLRENIRRARNSGRRDVAMDTERELEQLMQDQT